MTLHNYDCVFPRDNDGLALLHEDVAMAYEGGLPRVAEMLAFAFRDDVTHMAMNHLLFDSHVFAASVRPMFERLGFREFLKDERIPDAIELTQFWRDGASYAGQGLAPGERDFISIEDRERRIKELISEARRAEEYGAFIVGNAFDFIWHGVAARAAIDFGGRVTLEGLHLLSDLSVAAIRNAVSIGELNPDENNSVHSDEANGWLERRRGFCRSRWRNPQDNQWPLDPDKVAEPDESGMIWVPQAADDDLFTPARVVRTARGSGRISITIGAKGSEEQIHDFYEALVALSKMEVARWRRPNSSGNWGIVRARGAWVAVSKADIDQQLEQKMTEI